jgi:hypothetical protein
MIQKYCFGVCNYDSKILFKSQMIVMIIYLLQNTNTVNVHTKSNEIQSHNMYLRSLMSPGQLRKQLLD